MFSLNIKKNPSKIRTSFLTKRILSKVIPSQLLYPENPPSTTHPYPLTKYLALHDGGGGGGMRNRK